MSKIAFENLDKYKKGLLKSKEGIIEELKSQGKTELFHVLSFGGGTQSSHLLEEHLRGRIHYDFIIFSDTGAEPHFIHSQVEWWQKRLEEQGCTTPFIITTHSSMQGGLEEMLYRYIYTSYQRFQLPLYFKVYAEDGSLKNGGLMPRQCTGDFKIIPVQQQARKLIKERLGLAPNKQIPRNVGIVMDIGFSFDEVKRVGGYVSHQSKYIYLAYPLIEKGLTTQDSIKYLIENGFPSRRSRCYFCPFNCDKVEIGMDWGEIIEHEPLSFLKACFFDDELRYVQAEGCKNMKSVPFFHYKRIPLKEAYPEEFEKLIKLYGHELVCWIGSWKRRIREKYELTR